jgi:hypothetical protein
VDGWLRQLTEVLVLFRYPYAAGQTEFRLFASLQDVREAIAQQPSRTNVMVFGHPALPIRGVVNDEFIDQCVGIIPDGKEYLFLELEATVAGRRSWFHHDSGTSHASLREDLEQSRGRRVAAGHFPPWLVDTELLASAIVPDQDGIVRRGVY